MSSEAEQSRAGSLEDSAVASADEATPKPCYLGLWVPVVLVVVAVSAEASRDSRVVDEVEVASEVASVAVEVVAASEAAAAVVISVNVVVIAMVDMARPAALHLVPALTDATATEVTGDPLVGMNLGEAVAHMMTDTAAAAAEVVAIATVADMVIVTDVALAATWNPLEAEKLEAEKVDAEKVGTERGTTTDLLAMKMAAENVDTTVMVTRIPENYDDIKPHPICFGGFYRTRLCISTTLTSRIFNTTVCSYHWIKHSQWDSYSV